MKISWKLFKNCCLFFLLTNDYSLQLSSPPQGAPCMRSQSMAAFTQTQRSAAWSIRSLWKNAVMMMICRNAVRVQSTHWWMDLFCQNKITIHCIITVNEIIFLFVKFSPHTPIIFEHFSPLNWYETKYIPFIWFITHANLSTMKNIFFSRKSNTYV